MIRLPFHKVSPFSTKKTLISPTSTVIMCVVHMHFTLFGKSEHEREKTFIFKTREIFLNLLPVTRSQKEPVSPTLSGGPPHKALTSGLLPSHSAPAAVFGTGSS